VWAVCLDGHQTNLARMFPLAKDERICNGDLEWRTWRNRHEIKWARSADTAREKSRNSPLCTPLGDFWRFVDKQLSRTNKQENPIFIKATNRSSQTDSAARRYREYVLLLVDVIDKWPSCTVSLESRMFRQVWTQLQISRRNGIFQPRGKRNGPIHHCWFLLKDVTRQFLSLVVFPSLLLLPPPTVHPDTHTHTHSQKCGYTHAWPLHNTW
jgi:hypothetical protein